MACWERENDPLSAVSYGFPCSGTPQRFVPKPRTRSFPEQQDGFRLEFPSSGETRTRTGSRPSPSSCGSPAYRRTAAPRRKMPHAGFAVGGVRGPSSFSKDSRGSKGRYRNGTLVGGSKDKNLRNPGSSILSRTQMGGGLILRAPIFQH